MSAKQLTLADVEFTIDVLPEDAPVRGNAMASGDDDFDRQTEDRIISDLCSGNEWAWCTIKVTAHYAGLEGCDYLGCCSYRNEDEFCQPDGYYPSMKDEAMRDLQEQIDSIAPLICD
jgi:hypothetical protein